jgi:hypothetical protein
MEPLVDHRSHTLSTSLHRQSCFDTTLEGSERNREPEEVNELDLMHVLLHAVVKLICGLLNVCPPSLSLRNHSML